jgi:hypothetical protein
MDNFFRIDVSQHQWVKNLGDDPEDLCSHGLVFAQIGSEVICDYDSGALTTSAAALHLMRTLYKDYTPGDFSGQLLPCCGFFITFDENGPDVQIHGCPNGIDWTITHLEDGTVKHVTATGTEAIIAFNIYRNDVMAFADAVEQFYKRSQPKVLPDDKLDVEGYMAFWNEWHRLRAGLTIA